MPHIPISTVLIGALVGLVVVLGLRLVAVSDTLHKTEAALSEETRLRLEGTLDRAPPGDGPIDRKGGWA